MQTRRWWQEVVSIASGLHLILIAGARGMRSAILTQPERETKADQQHGSEKEEDDRLLQPGDRRNGKAHGETKKCDLKRQEAYAGKERAESQECQEDEAGFRGRADL